MVRRAVIYLGAALSLAAGCSLAPVSLPAVPVDLSVADLSSSDLTRGSGGLGEACAADGDCSSGFCADGRCCNARCADACHACSLAGFEGQCLAVPEGQDPRDDCSATQQGCGPDGTCDGAGKCRLRTVGTVCQPAGCVAGVLTLAATCDGAGNCQPSNSTVACAPYKCAADGQSCASSCLNGSDCQNGNCVNQSCGPAGNGASCRNGADCVSGICAQGICCDRACDGACQSCSGGSCNPTASGSSDTRCVVNPPCGTDGFCDGLGHCRNTAAGTVCRKGLCNVTSVVGPGTCDGQGLCQAGQVLKSCGNYQCDPATLSCYAPPPCMNFMCAPGLKCKGSGSRKTCQ